MNVFLADLRALAVLLSVRAAAVVAGGIVAYALVVQLGLTGALVPLAAIACVLLGDQLGIRVGPALAWPRGDRTLDLTRCPSAIERTARLGLPAVAVRVVAA